MSDDTVVARMSGPAASDTLRIFVDDNVRRRVGYLSRRRQPHPAASIELMVLCELLSATPGSEPTELTADEIWGSICLQTSTFLAKLDIGLPTEPPAKDGFMAAEYSAFLEVWGNLQLLAQGIMPSNYERPLPKKRNSSQLDDPDYLEWQEAERIRNTQWLETVMRHIGENFCGLNKAGVTAETVAQLLPPAVRREATASDEKKVFTALPTI